ncbi:InlB B-repeat-containing protein [Culicoidibacter larvae]|uniref:Uncharacterized protein n=1 Tax=Culicoidibacter larvae TaxID=2579976 RepID=A0A5R8QGP9_9FIRM|nr:InlB B-repeat-containing protein [Culicoidibacter larvae]TLG77211.1 hypothetical protein FEZ08_00925 [Culicoidibacter larvae]
MKTNKTFKQLLALLGAFILVFSAIDLPVWAMSDENISSENSSKENVTEDVATSENVEATESEILNNTTAQKSLLRAGETIASLDGVSMGGDSDSISVETWTSGLYSKTLDINATFDGSVSTTNRQISISLVNGLAFDTIPGMVAVDTNKNNWKFDASTLPKNLQGIIVGATYTPSPQLYWWSPRSGTLVYEIAAGTTSVNMSAAIISDMVFNMTDVSRTLTDAIKVQTLENGVQTAENVLESYILNGTANPSLYINSGGNVIRYLKPGESSTIDNSLTVQLPGLPLQNNAMLTEEITYVFRMNKNAGFQTFTFAGIDGADCTTTVDRTSDPVYDIITLTMLRPKNFAGNKIISNYTVPAGAVNGSYRLEFVSSKTKLIGASDYVKTTNFAKVFADATMPLVVVDDTVGHLTVDTVREPYYAYNPVLDSATLTPLGAFDVFNPTADVAADQKMQLTFDDTNIGVKMVQLVTGRGDAATNIVITTNKGNTINIPSVATTANNEKVVGFVRINLADYGVTDATEYISSLTYDMGDIGKGGGRNNSGHASFVGSSDTLSGSYIPPVVYYGEVLTIPASKQYSAKIAVTTTDKEFSDADTAKATNTMTIIDAKAMTFITKSSITNDNPALSGGDTRRVTFSFLQSAYKYLNTVSSANKGFEVYIREDQYFSINKDTISANWEGNTYSVAAGTLVATQTVDNTGAKVYKLSFPDVILGAYKLSGSTYDQLNISYDLKVKPNAPTTSFATKDLIQILPTNGIGVSTSNGGNAPYNNPNIFNVDSSGSVTKYVGTPDNRIALRLQAQKDFVVTTAANLNGGPWVSYDFETDSEVINLNPSGEARYKLNVVNNSGEAIEGYTALVPIPKYGESTGLQPTNPADFKNDEHLQKENFGWTASLLEQIDTSGSKLSYQVLYATTYETEKDSPNFVAWDAITDKNEIRMVKIVTTDSIADGVDDEISFPLALTDPLADAHAGNINIYSARIHRVVGGTSGYKPSEPVALRLKTGAVKGIVFDDTNRNGLQDGSETGRNGIAVRVYEKGTTTLIDSTTTKTINGVDGSYEFLGLDKDQEVDIIFINPNTNDSTRFSAVTSGGSTPTEAADHLQATTAGVKASATGYDTIHAGIITPVAVNFNAQGGSTAATTVNRYPGETIVSEPDAVKTGHTFTGWFTAATGGSKVTFPYISGTTDVTLHAQYTANKYLINYDIATNGGEGTAPASENVTYDTTATQPANPVKTGYTFSGWYDAASGGSLWNFATNKMPANDVQLYAQFTINNYTLTLDNEGVTTNQTVEYNALATEPTEPTKTGFTFDGWFDAVTGGTEWNFATDTMPAANKTLYAQYTRNNYTVTFNDQGTTTTDSVAYEALITEPTSVPTKPGYTFSGWYDAATGGTKWDFAADTMPAANKTLYAQFTADDQTITFDVNTGDAKTRPADVVQPTDSTFDLDAVTAPSKPGYSFVGWFDASDTQHSGTITMPVGGLDLIAKWSADDQVISFNSKGGSGIASITAKTDSDVDLDTQVTTRPGYQFDGWFDASDNQYSGMVTMPAGGLALEAHWTALDQTITFDVNGGDVATQPADLVQPTDSTVHLDAVNEPTWFGHKFLGWQTADGTAYSGDITMPVDGLTLYAQWQDLIVDGVWKIQADDVRITVDQLKEFIKNGTLEAEILSRSNAKAWDESDGRDLNPLYANINVLVEKSAAGTYLVTIVYLDPSGNELSSVLATDITVYVDEVPVPELALPVTGGNELPMTIGGAGLILLAGIVLISRKKSRK